MATDPVEQRLAGLRAQLSDALGDDFGTLAATALKQALASTKRVRVQRHCTKCSCSHIEYVEVQDSPNAVAAVKLAVEQLEGRPGVQDEAEHDRITILRVVSSPNDLEAAKTLVALALEGQA